MTKLLDVCHQVRSKNAGPFWITVDLFFNDRDAYERYAEAAALQASSLAPALGADPTTIKRFLVPHLSVLKISYPRPVPQGGAWERDMHGGQQYVRLLDIELFEGKDRRHPA